MIIHWNRNINAGQMRQQSVLMIRQKLFNSMIAVAPSVTGFKVVWAIRSNRVIGSGHGL